MCEEQRLTSRLPEPARRVLAYWNWWRALFMGATVALVALGAAIDNWLWSIAAVVAGFVPLTVLLGLGGSRTDAQHRSIVALEKALARHDQRFETADADMYALYERVEAEGAAARQAALRARSLPGPGDLTVLVAASADGEQTAKLLAGLSRDLNAAVECLVADRSNGTAVGVAATDLMGLWPGLKLVDSNGDSSVVDDLNDVRGLAEGRYLLALDDHIGPSDLNDIIELCRWVPDSSEVSVGGRVAKGRSDIALVKASALDESGGWVASFGIDERLGSTLGAMGLRVEGLEQGEPDPPTRAAYRIERKVLSIAEQHHQASGAIGLFPQAEYHTHELLPLAESLRDGGAETAFIVADRWWNSMYHVMHRAPDDVFAQPPAGAWIASLRGVVTMNDWARDERELVDAANGYGVPTIGKIEGVQDFGDADIERERRPYQRVRHVLCQGPNDVRVVEAFGGNAHLVGSSRLERLWAQPPRTPHGSYVVINLNFTWNVLEHARDEFLQTAIEGCKRAGLDYVISAHPAERPRAGISVATAPMSELLTSASMLISRFSTVPFEAMARGVPFIYHNPHGEGVDTFRSADGAFETSTSARELADALDDAKSWVSTYRRRCEPFFRRQVDIDPATSSAQRAGDAIMSILADS